MQGRISDPGTNKYGLASAPLSLYHLIKRWSGITYNEGPYFSYRPARTVISTYSLKAPLWFYLESIFKYIHGGFEVLISIEPIMFEVQIANNPEITTAVSITEEYITLCGGILQIKNNKPLGHIPYRCEIPYSFHEYPIFGFHGDETYQRTTYSQSVAQILIFIKFIKHEIY
ncbi:hypothetical protein A3Q56_04887 [Intoshia linei]|uniref:Uncharacterized protein n=1 Tax=Intoshia linei TaxID=1819745 RepID=A0A177AZD0_9BILA|nr:hypothetical protein A3Q56_04887 [Intoshia linei]